MLEAVEGEARELGLDEVRAVLHHDLELAVALGALPLRDEVEHVDLREKIESRNRISGGGASEWVHMLCWDKKVMHERHRHAEIALKRGRTQRRDEKYAGRAGPPDCAEAEAEAGPEAAADTLPRECEREESVGDWDVVGADEHLRSPRSCRPPCISHTQARCTVS